MALTAVLVLAGWMAQGASPSDVDGRRLAADNAALQQHWRIERPTDTPDAAGAVRGLAQAVDDWLPQLAGWLAASACR